MTIGFRPLGLNLNIIQGIDEQIFPVKILEAAGGVATVSVNGVIMRVKTAIPLTREQLFLVKQEQRKDGTTAWRILRELKGEDVESSSKLAKMLSDLLENIIPKQETGRQLLSAQPLPLFLYLPVKTEVYLLSMAADDSENEQVRLVLEVDSEVIGKVRIDLNWRQGVLGVRSFVEKEETRKLIEKHWPDLADRLEKGGLQVRWLGCTVNPAIAGQLLNKSAIHSIDILI